MKFSKAQIDTLRIYAAEAKSTPEVIAMNAERLIDALMAEAERVFDEPGITFSLGLRRSKLESLPWGLKFDQFLGECFSNCPAAELSTEEVTELKRLGILK